MSRCCFFHRWELRRHHANADIGAGAEIDTRYIKLYTQCLLLVNSDDMRAGSDAVGNCAGVGGRRLVPVAKETGSAVLAESRRSGRRMRRWDRWGLVGIGTKLSHATTPSQLGLFSRHAQEQEMLYTRRNWVLTIIFGACHSCPN
jgi:hypothetical protein